MNFIPKAQNIFNLIGQEEYNIGRIVLSISIGLFDTKTTSFDFYGVKISTLIIHNLLINNNILIIN